MSKKIKALANAVKHPSTFIFFLANHGLFNSWKDENYLKLIYRLSIGKKLNLKDPSGFNEKIQWLKLNDRKQLYTTLVDKYAVRNYVKDRIGEKYLIPLLGHWKKPEDIDFDKLPEKFVLKCNHNSGLGMCICIDKSKLNINKVINNLNTGLKQNFYLTGREWPYKDVPRLVIAEKFMEDTSNPNELTDYKFMCFNGKHYCTFTCTERFSKDGLKVTFFDKEWNVMPFKRKYPVSTKVIEKPINYEEMIQCAEKLSEGLVFARIDFYEINGKVYFGEITLHPGCGFEEFDPYEWDLKLGSLIDLTVL